MKARIRFWSQQHATDCAPVAVLNLFRWFGKRINMRDDYALIKAACGWSLKYGTPHRNLARVLRGFQHCFQCHHPRTATAESIRVFLHGRNTAVILSYRLRHTSAGHTCLLVRDYRGVLTCINGDGLALSRCLKKCGPGFPSAWFLTRK
jgi:hypothetical protein